jgi:hypothetical protein
LTLANLSEFVNQVQDWEVTNVNFPPPGRADRPMLFCSEAKETKNIKPQNTNKKKNQKKKKKKKKKEKEKRKQANTRNTQKQDPQKVALTTKTQTKSSIKEQKEASVDTQREKNQQEERTLTVNQSPYVDFNFSAYTLGICATEPFSLAHSLKVILNRNRRLSTLIGWVAASFSIKCSPQKGEWRPSEPHSRSISSWR